MKFTTDGYLLIKLINDTIKVPFKSLSSVLIEDDFIIFNTPCESMKLLFCDIEEVEYIA